VRTVATERRSSMTTLTQDTGHGTSPVHKQRSANVRAPAATTIDDSLEKTNYKLSNSKNYKFNDLDYQGVTDSECDSI